MRLEYYPMEKLRNEILEILRKRIDLNQYRVFFFGSRVTGNGNDRSDIDVGIEGPEPLSWRIKSEIGQDIENIPTLYKIDVVDFREISSEFRSVAMEKTESIN